jgi:tetratricopeptide (TPR) repeat protein
MHTIPGHAPDTSLLGGTGELADDYELRHVLSAATAYLDAGQVDDAEDLIQEALETEPDHPAVQALARRLAHVQGVPDPFVNVESDTGRAVSNDVLMHFTSPLPGTESQSPSIQRMSSAGEKYFADDRVYSALDLTQIMCAEAPDFLPGFVRLAEIQIALGRFDQAKALYRNLKRRYEVDGEQVPWLVESLGVSLNPGDTSALIGYAMTLIEAGEASALDPFVPAAISRAVDMNVDAARKMADAYIKLRPEDENAKRVYLNVVSASADSEELLRASRLMVEETSSLDLLSLRLAAELVDARDSGWIEWLERTLKAVRHDPACGADVLSTLQSVCGTDFNARASLASALLLNAQARWSEAVHILDGCSVDELTTPVERFAASFARAIALERTGHADASSAALEVAQSAYDPDIEPFARTTTLFGVSASPSEILGNFVRSAAGESPLDALVALRQTNPDRLDVRLALADAYLAAGNVREGVRELRYVAEVNEKSGNLQGMLESMRKISQAVPSNIEMKAKLIEGYLRRGILDDAVDELESIGGLYLERGRNADAVAAFTRAAEIASALGDFARGNTLFDSAVNADPDNVPVRHAAVAFYLQTGSVDSAAEHLREVVRIALSADDRDEAVAALHQIIALAPHDPGSYHKLGEVLTSLGEYTQAERVYRRLASMTPNDPVLQAKQSALAVLAATN